MGASWVRENILRKYPHAQVAVYTVWVNIQSGDSKGAIDPSIVSGPRSHQFWDSRAAVSAWLRGHLGSDARSFYYDYWVAFGPGARWQATKLSRPLGSGQTVIGTTGALQRALAPFLGRKA